VAEMIRRAKVPVRRRVGAQGKSDYRLENLPPSGATQRFL